jgi:hypothetical protein
VSEPIAWGAKVTNVFILTAAGVAAQIGVAPSELMACMAWESGATFSASIQNAAGSGAVGLIQFMPSTAAALGTSTEALKAMTPEKQLQYVATYFKPWSGRLKNLGDLYMAILWPGAIGKPDDFVLFDRADPAHPIRYAQNAGLDFNRDGKVTRGEAYARVAALLQKGMQPGYVGQIPDGPGNGIAQSIAAIGAS